MSYETLKQQASSTPSLSKKRSVNDSTNGMGHAIFAKILIWGDVILMIYWVIVLTIVSTRNPTRLTDILLFALHFAGFVALVAVYENAIEKFDTNEDGVLASYAAVSTMFPYSWFFGTLMACITDVFSLMSLILEKHHDPVFLTTESYIVSLILYGVGSGLSIVSMFVILFDYIKRRKKHHHSSVR